MEKQDLDTDADTDKDTDTDADMDTVDSTSYIRYTQGQARETVKLYYESKP